MKFSTTFTLAPLALLSIGTHARIGKDQHRQLETANTTTDHSATVEKLTTSYFLNDDFWFTVPGGRMMQTFKDLPRGDVYDNSMGVQFMIRQERTVEHGKDILNAFANQMYCDLEHKPDDGWRGKDTTASKESVQLFRRWFVPENAHQTTPEGSWQEEYVTGNNIFVGLAFAHASTVLAQDENAACYALAAYDIADAIWETRKCDSHDFPRDGDGANTESMADWVGLLNTLNQYDEYYTQVLGTVDFYDKAYNKDDPSYFTSLSCSNYPSGSDDGFGNAHPADTTFWSSMANAPYPGLNHPQNMINAMKNVLSLVDVKNEQSDIDTYQGFDYNGIKFSSKGNAIQWEATASAGAMSMMHSLDKHKEQMASEGLPDTFQSRKMAFIDSITHLIETTGSVPGSVQSEGSYHYYPGLNWSYPPIAHLSASAWSGLALLMDNASDTDAFNVFATQKGMLSRAEAQAQCTNIKQTLAKCN